jgi:ABC-type uncharacterized transport system substrate-binding protein
MRGYLSACRCPGCAVREGAGPARHGVEALLIVPLPELHRDSEVLPALSAKAGLPTIGGFRESAQQGLMIGYGPSIRELGRQAAGYVERIFNGVPAGELRFKAPPGSTSPST